MIAVGILRGFANASTGIHILPLLTAMIVTLVGSAWLYLAEPWYDDALIQRLNTSPTGRPGAYRDDTASIVETFPNGMARDEALRILSSNGFSCGLAFGRPGSVGALNCQRRPRWGICDRKYTIQILLDHSGAVSGRSALSAFDCF